MSKKLSHILCIDDEEDILTVAQMCLESVGGYHVTACSDGRNGIQKALMEKPDLIMVDVMMPEMDGPATLKAIHSHFELDGIPVIFMTARVQPSEIQEYLDMGGAGVVAKPFDPMGLSAEVQRIWDRLNP